LVVVTEPSTVVTVIGPDVALAGTATVILFVAAVAGVAAVPLKLTVVVPLLRFAPLIVTIVPTGPNAGEKLLITGSMIKLADDDTDAAGVVTAMDPSPALAGTVAVICVSEFTVKVAGVESKATWLASVRLTPVILIESPARPLAGANAVMAGWP
jgi:hypothetical protein